MNQIALFYRFGAALAIGFLIGLEREYAYGGKAYSVSSGNMPMAERAKKRLAANARLR
jgi:hypothetical protein